jgi:Luciferase-like monooxygenase
MRAEKLEEGLEVLNGLWSGETFSFQGKHYQVTDTQMLPKPLQSPRIPIWLAGGWPRRKPLRRAAHWDGIQKAGGPMIGLPARITLFVVVCVSLLIVFFRVKTEDQVNTWSSIFSCDTSPVYTHHVLIHINQKLRRVFSVSSAYLCQFVADVAFRRCSIRYRTVLSEMQPNIEYGQTLRGSASPHLRALFIHLKDSSKQANEFLHEPHTASF